MYMSWAVYGTVFRITAGYRSMFYSDRRLSERRNNTLKRANARIFKLASVFKEARKNLAFDYLGN
jgi:hypothetical protein